MSQTMVEKGNNPKGVTNAHVLEMSPGRRKSRQNEISQADLAYGQQIIIMMRWILVASGLFLVLWNATSVSEIRIQVIGVLLLAIFNFYLQAQLLMKRPIIAPIVFAATAMDLIIITLMIISGGSGFKSVAFVYYFPAIAAFAVAFPSGYTLYYTVCLMGLYFLIGFADGADFLVILSRLLMIGGVAFCGNLYLRIERGRREAERKTQEELLSHIRGRQSATLQKSAPIVDGQEA